MLLDINAALSDKCNSGTTTVNIVHVERLARAQFTDIVRVPQFERPNPDAETPEEIVPDGQEFLGKSSKSHPLCGVSVARDV